MTATDELRRMLDDAGVEWGATDTHRLLVTSWKDTSGHSWAFMEHRDGSFSKLTAYHITPAQAVEATLGRGTLQNAAIVDGKWTTVLLPDIAWQGEDWPDFLSVAHDSDGEWRTYVQEPALNTLPYFWTADGVLHIRPRRMPTSVHVECDGEVVEMEPGRWTCKDESECIDRFICSLCGAALYTYIDGEETLWMYDHPTMPSFCPNCGARIEVE